MRKSTISLTRQKLFVFFQQTVVELAEHCFARLHAIPDLTYQAWVCDQASAVHKTVCVREALGNALIICYGKQVAVVAQGIFSRLTAFS